MERDSNRAGHKRPNLMPLIERKVRDSSLSREGLGQPGGREGGGIAGELLDRGKRNSDGRESG